MNIVWQAIYISMGAFILIIIPVCMYYYEADEEWTCVMIIFITLVGKNQILILLLILYNSHIGWVIYCWLLLFS